MLRLQGVYLHIIWTGIPVSIDGDIALSAETSDYKMNNKTTIMSGWPSLYWSSAYHAIFKQQEKHIIQITQPPTCGFNMI